MKSFLAILVLLCSTSALAGNYCKSNEWYSEYYDRCFDKNGHCSQYDRTNSKTCNTSKDYLKCDWDHRYDKCEEEYEPEKCDHDEWYSKDYNRCFKKYGHCSQYNYTDSKTCNTSKDNLKCDWDHRYDKCEEEYEPEKCDHDEWYSKEYKKCFGKYGYCSQYNYTDKDTCNTGKDHLKCDWNSSTRKCFEEGDSDYQCDHDEWWSSTYKKCYKKDYYCSQYDRTDRYTCETSKDYMNCSWDSYKKECKKDY